MGSASLAFVLLLLIAVLFGVFLYFTGRSMDKSTKEAKDHVIALGLIPIEMERDVPYFYTRYGKPKIRREMDTGYCLQHKSPKTGRWSFLQRQIRKGAEYPNGWTLDVKGGTVPDGLRRVLHTIAHEWEDEYLEFEFYPEKVCAFWREWGGAEVAQRIYHYLREISEAAE